MDLAVLLDRVKHHPHYERVGMVLCHNGVVRGTSRDGRAVRGLRVAVDRRRLAEILDACRARPGIVDVQVEIAADRDLAVGDDVMLLVVAGDVRENVIRTLEAALNEIKGTVTRKTEYFVS
jgi:molybdopterin synthase catalytic subunit